jgi:hypothetical protein
MANMEWEFDISKAPGPRVVTRTMTTVDGNKKTYKETIPTHVLIALDDEERSVISSYFIPPTKHTPAGRWAFAASDQVPLAWKLYDKHPKDI